uniref:Uncharacterized protein n=1 Tax=Triticum urartu TaxID=4572 RepID=A0A8R7PA88_TRIUA
MFAPFLLCNSSCSYIVIYYRIIV